MQEASSGQALLQQHRSLLELVARIESVVSTESEGDPSAFRKSLRQLLRHFIRELEIHFLAEGAALEADFSDNPGLKSALRALDAEHPALLHSFDDARKALEGATTWALATEKLASAIEKFRDHEAREDALFRVE